MPTPYGWLADADNVGVVFLPDVNPGDRLVNLCPPREPLFLNGLIQSANGWTLICYRLLQVGKDQLYKQVFNIRTNDADPKRGNKGFQMYVWSLTQNQDIVIIQFIGDASLAVDIPHGNAKSANARPHHKTAPSTMRDMKESREKPNQYYRQARASAAPDLVTQVKSIFILV